MNLGRTSPKLKCLLLANGFYKQYHVLRGAAEAGLSVCVLGGPFARRLKRSRFCAVFEEWNFNSDGPLENVVEQIERIVLRENIDFVMCSDCVTSLLLIKNSGRLSIPTFPMPDLETFQTLNDKWCFYKLCTSIGVSVPETFLYQNVCALKADIAAGRIKAPITVKPTNLNSGIGVHHIILPDDLSLLDVINYEPIVAQRHIIGNDVGVSMLCYHGRIRAWTAQLFRGSRGSHDVFFRSDACFEAIAMVANVTKFNGVAQFDARLELSTGRIYFVECNPRFWASFFTLLNAGLNYISLGLSAATDPPDHLLTIESVEAPRIRGLIRKLVTPWKLTRGDVKALQYFLSDPVPCFMIVAARMRAVSN